MDHNLQLLGIAKKAGYLAVGGEATSAAARSGTAALIITAADASDSVKRRAQRDSEFCGAEFAASPYTRFELGSITGRGSPGTLAIMDAGLARTFIERLAKDDPARYSGISVALAEKHIRSLSGKKRRASGERHTGSGERHPKSGEARRASGEGHTRSGEKHTVNGEKHTKSSSTHTVSGETRRASGKRHTISGNRRTAQ